ncbi:TolC family protein [Massilia sp. erpn]|uniref:TolC family protein n=1 Tax=Massilia sp. erpn TaxID=2738142 RepID=UPI0021027865|nr:TolC family protein [Massilia sp. erpn]
MSCFHCLPPWRSALLAALLLPVAALAQTELTLAEAQRLAVQRSGQIRAQDAAIDAAREMAVAAGQLPDPVLKVGVDNMPLSGPDRASLGADSMTMRRIGVMQEWISREKRSLNAQRYEREADRGRAARADALAAVWRDAALAWYERHYADAAQLLLEAQLTQAADQLRAAEASYRAGRGSLADVLAAKTAIGQLEDRRSEAQRRSRAAETGLARWIGSAASMPLAPAPRPAQPEALPSTAQNLESHPQLQRQRTEIALADTEAQRAQANRKSNWTWEVTFQQRGPGYPNMASFGVSVPLQWDRRQRQDRELAAQLARAAQARAEHEELLHVRSAETQQIADEWRTLHARHERYVQELLPLSAQRVQALLAAYSGGKATLAELLAAQRDALDMRLQALQLEADSARLRTQLDYLIPAMPEVKP